MVRAVQKRTLQTRARLVEVAQALVARDGYAALRVEDVVAGAGVAKGTFFAHFRDKEALMERLISAELAARLARAGAGPVPDGVDAMIAALEPYHGFLASERYVFDIALRYSGAAQVAEVGPMAQTFEDYVTLVAGWIARSGGFRRDVPPDLLAEGVQAFAIQSLSLQFCALHQAEAGPARMRRYLVAWLLPPGPALPG